MKKYAVGNWKMAPATREKAQALADELVAALRGDTAGVEIILCAPFVWLELLHDQFALSGRFFIGAQDLFWENEGAYTGEISAAMLKSLGAAWVIVGHSERRALGETNEVVAKKLRQALSSGVSAILCIGERTREGEWHDVLREEIESAFAVLDVKDISRLIVAYEPVWAIGSTTPDTPDNALTVALFVRKLAREKFGEAAERLPVLYGGAVDADTVKAFAAQEGLDGVLVGRASLNAEQFSTIVRALIPER